MPEQFPALSLRKMEAPCGGSSFRRGFSSEEDQNVSGGSDHRANMARAMI
jgi:hypothetical protein